MSAATERLKTYLLTLLLSVCVLYYDIIVFYLSGLHSFGYWLMRIIMRHSTWSQFVLVDGDTITSFVYCCFVLCVQWVQRHRHVEWLADGVHCRTCTVSAVCRCTTCTLFQYVPICLSLSCHCCYYQSMSVCASQLSPSITRNHQTSPVITRHHQTSPVVTSHHQWSPDITNHHQTSPDITSDHQTSPIITRHH